MAKKTKDVEGNVKPTKKIETKKKTASKTSPAKSAAKKTTTTKKTSAKVTSKSTTKKTTTKKATAKSNKTNSTKAKTSTREKNFQAEYYDLAFKYNKTMVTVLAQTPTTLFVYWEISDEDTARLKQTYGDNFFEVTKPVLILYNDTLNYFFEIEINDFANSWYIHINDSKCEYHVELGRKPIPQVNRPQPERNEIENTNTSVPYIPYYVYITSSNNMSAPNDKVLFNLQSKITFRNVKTGKTRQKDIKEFKFITNYGEITLQELYKHLYPNENFDYKEFLRNPSSGLTSSR